MKKTIAILVAAFMIFTLVACGGGAGGGEGASSSGAVYTVDVEELDPTVYPDDYPLIPSGDFEAALNVMRDANMAGELKNYQDLVDIFFGIDGAYYENCDLDYGGQLYKYYGWYGDSGRSVLITFIADGKKLEYMAYTESGI